MAEALSMVSNDAASPGHAINNFHEARPCLVEACTTGDLEKVRILLDTYGQELVEGANDAFEFWCEALWGACQGGHMEAVRLLMRHGAFDRESLHAEDEKAFRLACSSGCVDLVRHLLQGEHGVDVNAMVPSDEDDRASGTLALSAACRGGHVEVVRLLLSLQGDRRMEVHAGGEDAFRDACSCGHVEVVRLLVS